uniref:Endonuclease/exonuclease/phosphatase domain-containing protein n=1 Tax=Octopus bimaculoides TaxID=37653 RepID=A0A0L8FKC3_OCTBM
MYGNILEFKAPQLFNALLKHLRDLHGVENIIRQCLKSRLERRSALIAKELQRYDIHVVAVAEARIHGKGNLVENSAGYHLFGNDREETCKRESGVGFATKTTLVSKFEELPCGHSDRLLSLRLPLRKGRYAILISASAPTMNSSEDDKLSFYLSLTEIIRSITHDDKVVILDDFNACVGKPGVSWKGMGLEVPAGIRGLCSKANILGFAVKEHQDWFDDNDEEISLILEEKQKAFKMLQNVDISANRTVVTYFKAVKATVQRKLKMMQENWWSERCDEIQEASNANNSKLFYS